MPIQGLPDPEKHRVCMRCAEWFEPTEGSLAVRPRFVSGGIADSIRSAAGDADLRFICHRCTSVRRKRKIILYALLALALVWAVGKDAGWF